MKLPPRYTPLFEMLVIVSLAFVHYGILRLFGFDTSPVGSITTGIAVFLLFRYWQGD